MNNAFRVLPDDKKQKILEAALEEFANNGYEKASTNAIVTSAGISKGILFHYFGSKKNLYLYTLDHVCDVIEHDFFSELTSNTDDFFTRFMNWFHAERRLMEENPAMYKLTARAFVDMPDEMRSELEERHDRIHERYVPAFMEGIDTSRFREDIPKEKIIEFVFMLVNAYESKLKEFSRGKGIELMENLQDVMRDFEQMMQMLMFGVLKK